MISSMDSDIDFSNRSVSSITLLYFSKSSFPYLDMSSSLRPMNRSNMSVLNFCYCSWFVFIFPLRDWMMSSCSLMFPSRDSKVYLYELYLLFKFLTTLLTSSIPLILISSFVMRVYLTKLSVYAVKSFISKIILFMILRSSNVTSGSLDITSSFTVSCLRCS